jgi:hypothetical protein
VKRTKECKVLPSRKNSLLLKTSKTQ